MRGKVSHQQSIRKLKGIKVYGKLNQNGLTHCGDKGSNFKPNSALRLSCSSTPLGPWFPTYNSNNQLIVHLQHLNFFFWLIQSSLILEVFSKIGLALCIQWCASLVNLVFLCFINRWKFANFFPLILVLLLDGIGVATFWHIKGNYRTTI